MGYAVKPPVPVRVPGPDEELVDVTGMFDAIREHPEVAAEGCWRFFMAKGLPAFQVACILDQLEGLEGRTTEIALGVYCHVPRGTAARARRLLFIRAEA